jgi:SEC-C motif-containing protein
LVRARFSAFALGEIEFLERTLHEDHPDRARPREALLFALRTASSTLKYMGLSFVEARPLDAHGVARALYLARVFRKGTDVSFYELAEFLHDGRGLRYRSGRTRDAHGVRAPEPGLSIDTF